MKKTYIVIGLLISTIVLQSVAVAASISSRVRVLETQSYKQNKQMQQQSKNQQQLKKTVNEGLQKIKDLTLKVEKSIKNAKKENRIIKASTDYYFP